MRADIILNNAKPPCHGCTKRKMGCHAVCTEYKEFRKELDNKNKHINRNKHTESTLIDYLNDNSLKLKKKRGV